MVIRKWRLDAEGQATVRLKALQSRRPGICCLCSAQFHNATAGTVSTSTEEECEHCGMTDCCAECQHCGTCDASHMTCSICDRCEDDNNCECCHDCDCTLCECCGNCGNPPDYCECCPECHDTENHYCGECDSYTCSPCGCNVEGLIGYGDTPGEVIWRSTDDSIFTSAWSGYPSPPDTAPYLGLEIECEAEKCGVGQIVEVWGESGQGWSSHDGSLSQGAECKTHPSTYEWLRDSNLAMTLSRLGAIGARAWEHDTCGLHIHISRDAFATQSHQWRFAHVHAFCFQNELVQLAGRKGNTHYCRFPHETNGEAPLLTDNGSRYLRDGSGDYVYAKETPTRILAGKQVKQNRSVAVNVNNATIELRYWKGSLSPRHVLGAAALEDALFRYTKDLTFSQIKAKPTWDEFLSWVCANLDEVQGEHIRALCDARGVQSRTTIKTLRKVG